MNATAFYENATKFIKDLKFDTIYTHITMDEIDKINSHGKVCIPK